jgi:uncharacterized protein YndB with AHSA1/START domain
MGRYAYTIHVEAPPELVFELWTDLERMTEWVGGVSRVSEPTGPIDVVGTRYTVYFGKVGSPTEIIDVERPTRYATRFGTAWLKGTNSSTFEPDGDGTRLTETFVTEGFVPGIMGWIFGHGSYRGSFLGELRHFGRIAEAEAEARRRAGDEAG